MKPKLIFVGSALLSLLLVAFTLQAQVPPILNYQGKLAINGAPASGMVTLIFSIYPSENERTALWSETRNNVPFINGLFNVQLGEVNELPDSLFTRYSKLYLGIKIGTASAPELTPRSPITSVAYARKANSANALDAPDGIPSKAVFVDKDGNVGIGTTNPKEKLDIQGNVAISGTVNDIDVKKHAHNLEYGFSQSNLVQDNSDPSDVDTDVSVNINADGISAYLVQASCSVGQSNNQAFVFVSIYRGAMLLHDARQNVQYTGTATNESVSLLHVDMPPAGPQIYKIKFRPVNGGVAYIQDKRLVVMKLKTTAP